LKKQTLAQLTSGESATIDSFMDDDMSLKLLEMGCLPGESVKIDMIAPLGDPIAICVAGYVLSLRKDEAAKVMVSSKG
jgi:ferrous iron transport protein A